MAENIFPTIKDARDRLSELIEQGLGELPVQVLIVPDSTMQAVAIANGGPNYDRTKPALMIDLFSETPTGRLAFPLISTERFGSQSGMLTTARQ